MSTPVVQVGATVSVENEATGEARMWTIVRADPSAGEISAATPVAQALIGRSVGETVTVAAARPTRYRITAVVPVPEPPAIEPRPLPNAEILVFGPGDDDAYEEWVRLHPNGYVIKPADRVNDDHILHHAECWHLGLDGKDFTLRTAKPRSCCSSLRVLEHECRAETGSLPRRCGTCFG
jgi:hypothetical protein